MNTLSLDLETFSGVDITKCGTYKYAESPDFEILLFGYSVDGGEVHVVDIASGDTIPQEVLDALTDDSIIKWAYNANFERVCLSRYLSDLGVLLDPFHDNHPLSTECARFLNPESWRCTMVWAAYMGLPLSLAAVGSVLGLEEQNDRGKIPHPLLLLPLRSHQGERRQETQSPLPCPGQVGNLQSLQPP